MGPVEKVALSPGFGGRSEWITGRSPSPSVAIASSSMPSAMAAPGLRDSVQETTMPSNGRLAITASSPLLTAATP